MKVAIFFTFLVTLAKASLWISIGILIKNYLDPFLSLITRRPIPDGLIHPEILVMTKKLIEWIGIILIVIGICIALSALVSMIVSYGVSTNNFNIKF